MTRNCDINWYKGRMFLDVLIMLNHESMFWWFLPCDTNCIWSDLTLTLSQLSSACFATNGTHAAEESWASWQTETIRHNPRRIPREVLAKILFWNFRQVQHCGGDRGCLESQGLHYLKHWSIVISRMPEALKSLPQAVLSRHAYVDISEIKPDCRRLTGLLSMSLMSMTQKLLSRFWSWVTTWPSLLFDYVVFTWLYPAGFFNFEVSQSL